MIFRNTVMHKKPSDVDMKEKRVFYCEVSYIIGIVVLALGTALIEWADFGLSMIVAPAYLIHLKVSVFWPFFSFGMSEYVFQALLLVVLSLVVRTVKKKYFLSFVTAFLYGLILDCFIGLVALLPISGIVWQLILFFLGLLICTFGVALLFRTYFPPEAYEIFVKDISEKYHFSLSKTKTVYDCGSCVLSIVLSLCLFGGFVGINWGTIVCAVLNGWLIGRFGNWMDRNFVFRDALSLRNKIGE